MPEYLTPGVYIEETRFRAKSIEGVSTSTTAFAGPTRRGPVASANELPELLTSFADFVRIYGGLENLNFGAGGRGRSTLNFLAHAVRAFFSEGGSRLYVGRVLLPRPGSSGRASTGDLRVPPVTGTLVAEDDTNRIRFVARFAGCCGNGTVPSAKQPRLQGIQTREIITPAPPQVLENAPDGSLARTGSAPRFSYLIKRTGRWFTLDDTGGAAAIATDTGKIGHASLITLTVISADADGRVSTYGDLGYDRDHPRWVGRVMAEVPTRRADPIGGLYAIRLGTGVNARQLLDALFPMAQNRGARAETTKGILTKARRASFAMTGGDDGLEPDAKAYRSAFDALAALDDISIVATPGSSAYRARDAIRGALITHAEERRMYRIAVLDTGPGQTPGAARKEREAIDTRCAALYYPWVVVANPGARPGNASIAKQIALPPSGFICGIYARNDAKRGVHKAPAKEVVRSALRLEGKMTIHEHEMLNPLGVNCLRFFRQLGYVVWGARTASADPLWKYVNVRRYFVYLEASIDRGTQWAVFEPNGEPLWANICASIYNFLYNEWINGALPGSRPEEAFFVRCDRTTMTQNDLDNGRLVCLIGVAPLKPAEFVIFRIGQKTADTCI